MLSNVYQRLSAALETRKVPEEPRWEYRSQDSRKLRHELFDNEFIVAGDQLRWVGGAWMSGADWSELQ